MTQLLLLKEHVKKMYQKYSFLFNPLFRFFIGFITFFSIDQVVGYNPELHHIYIEVLLGLVGMILPLEALIFIAAVFIVVHIFYASRVLALSLAIIFFILYLLYVEFVPKHGYIIMMVPIAFALHIPYGIPVLIGLLYAPISLLPMSIGVGIYYMLQTLTSVVASATDDTMNLFQVLIDQLASDSEMYVTIGIFVIVSVIVYVIRNMKRDYSFELAVLIGIFINTILMLIANYLLAININIFQFLLGTIVSGLLVWLIQLFRITLNYASVEYLQFEDEEYYYYVRAVPKMSVATQNKRVKRFNAHLFDRNETGQENE